jgi:hypothetical protein
MATVVAFDLVTAFRMKHYLFAIQADAGYGLGHKWPGSPLIMGFMMAGYGIILGCVPFASARPAREKKKHIPDPALSITPR